MTTAQQISKQFRAQYFSKSIPGWQNDFQTLEEAKTAVKELKPEVGYVKRIIDLKTNTVLFEE